MLIDNDLYARICKWADEHEEEMICDLQEFARIKSVSRADLAQENAPFGPDCRKMLDFAVAKAKSYGFDADDNGGWYGDTWYGDRSKAVGIIGHLDVVPEGDGWNWPPYAATREGDFLFGRGVSDNKSACIMGLYTMRLLRDAKAPLKRGVRAVFGVSEETGMADMKHMVANKAYPPISLVPDSAFPVNYAQKGTLRGEMSIEKGEKLISFTGGEVRNMVPPYAQAEIEVSAEEARKAIPDLRIEESENGCIVYAVGKPAHAASPFNGESAILILANALKDSGLMDEVSRKACEAFVEMSSDFLGANAGIACCDPETGDTTMVCGVAVTRGDRIGLSLDCRLSIATDLEAVQVAFRSFAESLGMQVDDLEAEEPFYIPRDDKRITLLSKVCEEVFGMEDTTPYTMGGGTYSRVVPNAITFGGGFRDRGEKPQLEPGHGGAHQQDEFLYIPTLKEALKGIACAVCVLDNME